MTTSSTAPSTGRLIAWSRSALIAVAFLFVAGITAKLLVSGSTPFGWSSHWSEHEIFGLLLQVLAYTMWLPALLGRVDRRFLVGAVFVAISFPTGDQTISFISALALITIPLWLGLRTLDRVRTASSEGAPSPAA